MNAAKKKEAAKANLAKSLDDNVRVLQHDFETARDFLGPGAQQVTRMADPIEVSYPVLFLASDEASYINGTELVVDNGFVAT